MDEQLQRQRFERKYFVSEEQAIKIREFVRFYLAPDDFSKDRPDFSYPVHSLYLDSRELMTYWATVHCEKKRFKLRVRYYDDNPASPLFFEIKRRENECVLKQRGVVRRDVGVELLSGQVPAPQHLLSSKPHQLVALQRFCHLMQRMKAHPTVHVAYMREAWVSEGANSVRVTIDRQVRGEPRLEAVFSTKMVDPVYPFRDQHVLELKFTDRFPDWFMHMVRHFNLVQTGAPKYCGSIMESGEDCLGQVATPSDPYVLKERLAQIIEYC